MKYSREFLVILLITVILSACAYTARTNQAAVNPGEKLQIYQSFSEVSNGSRLYFQNGVQVARRQVDKWSPYCSLYIYNDLHEADYVTSVQTGTFTILTTVNDRDVVKNEMRPVDFPLQLAALDWDRDRNFHPSYVLYRIDMKLYSVSQPDVKSLSCFQKHGSYGDYYPTRAQINQALGNIIRIESGA